MSTDRPRPTVYRARVIRRRRRLLAVLVVFALVAVGLVVASGKSGGGRVVYDRAAAAAYADKWALSANPAHWTSPDHDCANFVSQCVAAGGLRRFGGAVGTWRDNGRAIPSVGWVNCTAQERVWSVASGADSPYIVSTSTRLPRGWAAGDVVYLGNVVDGEAQWQHAIICVGKKAGRWIYDSHTVAHRHKTMATWYPAHFSLIRYCRLADSVGYR